MTEPRSAKVILELTDQELELVTTAARSAAERFQRAATRAAGELEDSIASGETPDRRPASVRIAKVLVDADRLTRFAQRLEETFVAALVAPSNGHASDDRRFADLILDRARKAEKGAPMETPNQAPSETTAESESAVVLTEDDLETKLAEVDASPEGLEEDLPDVISLSGDQEPEA